MGTTKAVPFPVALRRWRAGVKICLRGASFTNFETIYEDLSPECNEPELGVRGCNQKRIISAAFSILRQR